MNKTIRITQALALMATTSMLGLSGCVVATDEEPEDVGEVQQAFGEESCGTTQTVNAVITGSGDQIYPAGYSDTHCTKSVVTEVDNLAVANPSWPHAGVWVVWADAPPSHSTCTQTTMKAELWNLIGGTWVRNSTRTSVGAWTLAGCVVPGIPWLTSDGSTINGQSYKLVTTARTSWPTGVTKGIEVFTEDGF